MPVINDIYWYKLNKWDYVEFEDIDDAVQGYNKCIDLIMCQTRWVLDNMNDIKEFKVPWLNYSSPEMCEKQNRFYAVSAPYEHENKHRYVSKE